MNEQMQQHLDELAEHIAATISERRAMPTQVHHIHHAASSMFCLGRFGHTPLLNARSPTELHAQGAAFLAGLRFDCEQSNSGWMGLNPSALRETDALLADNDMVEHPDLN